MFRKTRTISILIICTLLFIWSCNEEGVNEPPNDQSTEEKIANNLIVLNGAGTVYKDTLIATQDSMSALNAMGQWIVSQENVKEAYYSGLNIVEIYFKNGLRSSIALIPTDEDGHHLLRGGGSTNHLSEFNFNAQVSSTKKIKNNKVLVLNPFTEEFDLGDYSHKLKLFEGGSEKFDVTVVRDKNVGLDDVNSFSDYGFIILNTHGYNNGFKIGTGFTLPEPNASKKWQISELLKVVKLNEELPAEKIENGELELASTITISTSTEVMQRYSTLVTDNYIRNSSLDLTDAVIFGNYCNSGHTADGPTVNNMPQALRSKGLATYYGYSFKDGTGVPVDDLFCKTMEDSLIINLAKDTDSTGVAHLSANINQQFYNDAYKFLLRHRISKGKRIHSDDISPTSSAIYFNQYFDKNYKYGGCDSATIAQKNFFLTADLGESKYEALSINASGQDVSQESHYILNNLRIKTVSNAVIPGLQGVTSVMEIQGTNVDYKTGKFAIGGPDAPYVARLTYQVAGSTIPYSSQYAAPNSGELVITNFCENYIEGTFHFKAAHILPDTPIAGATNGKFQIFLRL